MKFVYRLTAGLAPRSMKAMHSALWMRINSNDSFIQVNGRRPTIGGFKRFVFRSAGSSCPEILDFDPRIPPPFLLSLQPFPSSVGHLLL